MCVVHTAIGARLSFCVQCTLSWIWSPDIPLIPTRSQSCAIFIYFCLFTYGKFYTKMGLVDFIL